ncbi:MAG: glucose-6-phosphate isomerase [Deltaproteobacteria bacterium]|nr:glucose-6-phosphate isomerase [Deltaproteobacteria bacterium]
MITFQADTLFDRRLGEYSFKREDLDKIHNLVKQAESNVLNDLKNGKRGFADIVSNEGLIDATLKLAKEISAKYKNLVLVGIGGSALGPRALFKALRHPFHNLLPYEKRGNGMNLYFLENVDPDTFKATFDAINDSETAFLIITKSGSTIETMSQFLLIRESLMKKFGENGYRERTIAITDPNKGSLRNIVKYDRLCSLPIPENIGGRFSVFSPVGTFPAACCGIDIERLLKGAERMRDSILNSPTWENPALKFAQLMYIAYTSYKRNILVIMPYRDALLDTAEWFQQLWAESLGKERNNKGEVVNVGMTPVRALGVIDQHSQLQLYIEGPHDKIILVIGVKEFRHTITIPKILDRFPDVSYIGNHTLNELIKLEENATLESLIDARRPVVRIEIERVDEENIGELMMFLEFATAYAGELYQINAFDQPGVEHGKKILYKALKKPGY